MSENNTQNKGVGSKMIVLAIELAFIFAIPAALASIFGPFFDSYLKTNGVITIILLVLAFATSWFYVIRKYQKSKKELDVTKKE